MTHFGPGLDLIEINILTKFHEACIKTAPSEVYTYCFLRLTLLPSFWPDVTQFFI